ncbi:MAG: aminotransferase class V-fold PLP-dependent enzyme [Acidobacteriota bacterium]|nr:aminotransferase class V-fold PLP-dependent enzyme [Acidobacteriota bacterium]
MGPQLPIYLDNQATTPLDERVLDTMMPYLRGSFGNAASTEHRFGWVAEEAVKQAREITARCIGAESGRNIIFTSGATESNNLAILGAARQYARKGRHLITVVTEHKAVLDPCLAWEAEGGKVTRLGVDRDGLIDLNELDEAITEETVLVSVMAANNEIGVLQPIEDIGNMTRAHGVLFHTDATQAVGKIPIDVDKANIDLLSLSAHKIYGPKGAGALYVRRKRPRVSLKPLQYGGGHEQGMRSGTLNVPGIVGLGAALERASETMEEEAERLRYLRDRLLTGVRAGLEGVEVNGHPQQRLPGNLNLYFPGVALEKLIREIYADIAVSTGAACTSASPEPSHVLLALEPEGKRAMASVRFGIGRFNTTEEIDYVIERLTRAKALRSLARRPVPSL